MRFPTIPYAASSTTFAALLHITQALSAHVEQSTLGVFLPSEFDSGAFAASIVNVCSHTTTFALQCTSPGTLERHNIATAASCGPDAPVLTITEAESILAFSAFAPRSTHSVMIRESCAISGDWTATCVEEYAVHTAGTTSTHTATTTLTGSEFNIAQITVTAGASKLTTTDACYPSATPSPLINAGTRTLSHSVGRWLIMPPAMCLVAHYV